MSEQLAQLLTRLEELERQLAAEHRARLEALGQPQNSYFFPGTQPRGLS